MTQAALDILSPQAETQLKATIVSACDYQSEGKTTRPGGLKGAESAGQLGGMTRAQYLTLMCYFGANFSVRDLEELQNFLLTEVIMRQAWYKQGSYLANHKVRQRVDGLTLGAIGYQLTPDRKKRITKEEVARSMGIGTSAFNEITKYGDSWAKRFHQATDQLQGWLETSAAVVHNNSKSYG